MKIERVVIYILCFLFLIIGLSLALGLKDSKECLGNPLIYGANKISTPETGDLFCTCSFSSPDYAPFYFNEEKVSTLTSPINLVD